MKKIVWVLILFAGVAGFWGAEVLADPDGGMVSTQVISLDGSDWSLSTDPKNEGRQQQWWTGVRDGAKQVKVPWIIQDAFPGYHGVAWYWKEFTAPENPHVQGRYYLRFWMVDYMADVWVNDIPVGGHEGGEGVFDLDITAAVKPGQANRLAVRVLNPTNEPIDGIALRETPARCKVVPFRPGALFNEGGIVDSVELLVTPMVRVEDVWTQPDPKTGQIQVQMTLQNGGDKTVSGLVKFTVGSAMRGETLHVVTRQQTFAPGKTVVEAVLQVKNPRLWELNDPYLYRVTGSVYFADSGSLDELSTRCGFRDFRLQDGYFRLNGKRTFLKSSHTATIYPIGLHWPHDPDLARRELLDMKVMGFNAIRFFCAVPARYQLDLCDEIGFMIYEESYAGWFLADSPKMGERFDRSVREMILRDRNHPSVVMWGLLNETPDGPVARHAVQMLPMVREYDDTRVVVLNSSRWDQAAGGFLPEGIALWNSGIGQEPNLTFNKTKKPISALGVVWQPGQIGLHPGPSGEYSVARWTAPQEGAYSVKGAFASIAERATTDVHVFHNGVSIHDSVINLESRGNESEFAREVPVKKGDSIDFVVGQGNGSYGGDSTGLQVAIQMNAEQVYDLAADFSEDSNPSGPWSYGYLKPGEQPDTNTFALYDKTSSTKEALDRREIGSLSNPGSPSWDGIIDDQHPYQRSPHTAGQINTLRTVGTSAKPYFLSEYGIGSSLDLVKLARFYEQLNAEHAEDAQWYRQRLDWFLADWKKWNMEDTFASPEDYFAKCLARMAEQRKLGLNAIRANPNVIAHSMTGTTDCGDAGEGVIDLFRNPKPGTIDAIYDGWYPLRWCTFVEPVNVYRGNSVHLEAVLANEDVLPAGEYPVRVQVVGPDNFVAYDKMITVKVPDSKTEPPFALPVWSDDVLVDGPTGAYRFLVAFQKGGAAMGGDIPFYGFDPADMPAVKSEVILWGSDPELAQWLQKNNIKARPFAGEKQTGRELILVSGNQPGGEEAFRDLTTRIARGSTAIFLSPSVFAKGDQAYGYVPLANKGSVAVLPSWLYHKDEWCKKHPIFDGLQSGDLMDYTFYREVIPDTAWVGQQPPAEVVAGAFNSSLDYSAGLMVAVHKLGEGRFVLNTLLIRETLLHNPVAERLLRNMLIYGTGDLDKPLTNVPDDFGAQLQAMGF